MKNRTLTLKTLTALVIMSAWQCQAENQEFMKMNENNGRIELLTSVVDFVDENNFTNLTIVSATHIGTSDYYKKVQSILDNGDTVFFEGVKQQQAPLALHVKKMMQSQSMNPDELKKAREDSDLQGRLAKMMGLAYQMTEIDNNKKNFINVDFTLEQLMSELSKINKQHFISELVSPSFMTGMLLSIFENFLGNPANREFAIYCMINILSQEKLVKQSVEKSGMAKIILHDRNRFVANAAIKFLAENPKSHLVLFYGGAHSEGIAKLISKHLKNHKKVFSYLVAFDAKKPPASQCMMMEKVLSMAFAMNEEKKTENHEKKK